jgi:hypothetical protein
MRSIRRVAFVLGAALVLSSCDSGGVTPDGNPPPTPPAAPMPPGPPPPATSLGPPAPRSASELAALLDQEKARVSLRQSASQATYDSLKALWQDFLDRNRVFEASALLRCDPLQYAGDAKIVGPDGGDIDVGPHKVRVPRGALPWDAVITVESPTSLEVAVELSPKGVGFAEKLVLEIDYKHCTVSDTLPPLRGVWVSDSGAALEFPPSADDRQNRRLSVELDHFSKYAVAY